MIHTQDADFTLLNCDVLDGLRSLPDESVHAVITSPPYWGLRCYGVGEQLGLEPTPDAYVTRMVEVFREVRRVLRSDGTCWVNLGDSYASSMANGGQSDFSTSGLKRDGRSESSRVRTLTQNAKELNRQQPAQRLDSGLKPKDLVGIPWRVAFALQQPYYTGRIAAERDRVWLAAILDGEGTICGMRHVRDDGNVRTGCMTFITNTSEALLDECDRIWPGSRYSEKVTSEVARPCWRWELQSAEDRSALVRELYPYLIEKKRQALVAWNLLKIVQAAKKLGRGGENGETKGKRDLLVRILSDLNARRPVDLPSWLREPPSLLEPGWYLRSDIVWSKSNPMPESVTDRPTKAHEYVFLLSKSPRYFFDQEAVREPAKWSRWGDQTYSDNGAAGHYAGRIKPRTKAELESMRDRSALIGRQQPGNTPDRGGVAHPAPVGGRNVRSVWEIPTQPYPEAHFATYPEDLVRRCILAGTSERGCCPLCGKPWERETEASYDAQGRTTNGPRSTANGHESPGRDVRMVKSVETTGWRRPCDCAGRGNPEFGRGPEPIPCTVLDPFLGSGTTAYVARQHGRRSIGIELNSSYCELAARRMQQQSLFAELA